jgi:signal transduction histidine kinase
MEDHDKTKEQLVKELSDMRQRVAGLEAAEEGRKQMQEYLEAVTEVFLNLGVNPVENMKAILRAGEEILNADLVQYFRLEGEHLSTLSSSHKGGFQVADQFKDFICFDMISRGGDSPFTIENLKEKGYDKTDPLAREYNYKSFLGYPVILEGKTIGCVCLYDKKRRGFTKEEIEIAGLGAKEITIEEERFAHEKDLKSFIDIASHELRHPITILKGYVGSLGLLWDKLDGEKRREFFDAIEFSADRLSKLVIELLDVSRIERGMFTINKQQVLLKLLVEQAVKEMRDRGCEKEFRLSISEEAGSLNADPDKLVELLVILLDNAANHSPERSEIDIQAEPGGEGLILSVLDRGSGIPEEKRERIFERFYQVEDANHHATTGIGLGLYIARGIVEAHGGRIWCEPREGGGSVFRFTLPQELKAL